MEQDRVGATSAVVIDGPKAKKVLNELETVRLVYERLSSLSPDARVRALTYVQALLGEEP